MRTIKLNNQNGKRKRNITRKYRKMIRAGNPDNLTRQSKRTRGISPTPVSTTVEPRRKIAVRGRNLSATPSLSVPTNEELDSVVAQPNHDDIPVRTSKRSRNIAAMQVLAIGDDSTVPVPVPVLHNFVNRYIQADLPQIVSLPIPPARHAFLVYVKTPEKKIMISDWGGSKNRHRGKDKKYPEWHQYTHFMDLLEEKYKGFQIEYYPVDKEIEKKADKHHTEHSSSKEPEGSGGCSYYIFAWAEKHMV